MNKLFDKLNTLRAMLVLLALVISVNGFLYYYQDSDQDPITKEDEVLHSAQAPDPAEEKQPNRSVESSSQKKPDVLTDDINSAPLPKRSEDAAPKDRPDTEVDTQDADTQDADIQDVDIQDVDTQDVDIHDRDAHNESPVAQETPPPATATDTSTSPHSSEAGQPSPGTGGTYFPQIPAAAATAQYVSPKPQIGVN